MERHIEAREGLTNSGSFYLDRHLDRAGTDVDAPFVVTGDSGCGVSTILTSLTDDSPVFFSTSESLYECLSGLFRKLKSTFDIPLEIPSKLHKLETEFPRWIYIAGHQGPFTIVIDNIDLISGDGLAWLPEKFPENVKFIAGTMSGGVSESIRNRGWEIVELPPLSDDERSRLVDGICAATGRELDDDIKNRIISARESCNPLYLSVLARVILEYPDFRSNLDNLIESDPVSSLAGKILVRLNELNKSVRDVFSTVSISSDGIPEAVIAEIFDLSPSQLSEISRNPLLKVVESEGSKVFSLSHEEIGIAVKYLWLTSENDTNEKRTVLADYYSKQEKTPENIFRIINHLIKSKQWERLRGILSELPVFDMLWEADKIRLQELWINIKSRSDLNPARVYMSVIQNPSEAASDATLENMAEFLSIEGHSSEAVKLLGFSSERYHLSGDYRDRVRALTNQADTLVKLNDIDNAYGLYREAESICREREYIEDLARVLDGLSKVLIRLGEKHEAHDLLVERRDILKRLFEDVNLAECYGDLAGLLWSLGKKEEAIENYNLQEQLSRDIGDPAGLVRSMNSHGALLMKIGKLDDALKIFTEQEQLCRAIGYRNSLQVTLGNIGTINLKRGLYDDALKLFEEQEKIAREIDSGKNLAGALKSQALVHRATGNWETALKLLKEQERILRGTGDKRELRKWLSVQAQLMREHGRLRGALRLLLECEEISRGSGDDRGLQSTLAELATLYIKMDESDTAMTLLKDEEKLCLKLNDQNALQTNLAMQARLHKEKFDFSTALKTHLREEDVCRKSGNLSCLQRSLGNQALVLKEQGKLKAALVKHREEEKINRTLDNPAVLQKTLGNMATVLIELQMYSEALEKVTEQEEICGRLKLWEHLSIATGKRAWIWSKTGRLDEAKELIEDIYQHAIDSHMHAVINWMKPVYWMIKNTARIQG